MLKVVLVDDEQLFLKYLHTQFNWEQYGISVEAAFTSGRVCLEWLSSHKEVDGILTDMRMPGVNGVQLICEAKRINPRLYCVALSGYDDFPLVREAFLNGADDYLLKLDMNHPAIYERTLQKFQEYCDSQPPAEQETEDSLDSLKRYVEDSYCSDLQLADLAAKFHFSAGYLSAAFRKRFGISFKEYIVNLRIQKARYYLLHSDLSVSEICFRVGYHNLEHFSRQFKQTVHCAPTEYRRLNGSDEVGG